MSNTIKVTLFKGGSKERTIEIVHPVHPSPIPDVWTALQELEALIPKHHMKSFKSHAEDCQEAWHIAGALYARLAQMQALVDQAADIVERDLLTVKDSRSGVDDNATVNERLKELVAEFTGE